MRFCTLTSLSLCWLLACHEEDPASSKRDAGDAQQDAGTQDAGETVCVARGNWLVSLDPSNERCTPTLQDSKVTITVDDDSDAGSSDFVAPNPPTTMLCGGEPHVTQEVGIVANGCTINAKSLTKWCSVEPQCSEYQLVLHVHENTASVEGSYRHCWCGTTGPTGTTVRVMGSAVRQ